MAFQFPLATVLRYRQAVERQEELALKKILGEIARTRLQVADLTASIARARQSLNQALQESLRAVEIEHATKQIEAVMLCKEELLESLAELNQQRLDQTRKYQAAHHSRMTLSDMEARQRDEYERERVRLDQKFLDDIFAARAQRS